MATKKKRSQSKRRRSSGSPSNYSALYKGDSSGVEQAPVTSSSQTVEPAGPAAVSAAVDWQEEYAYVFKDLRLLVLVSVALFIVILVLGFFI